MNIVLIDDDKDCLISLKQLLEFYSFKIFAFQDPAIAVKEFSRDPQNFNVVISDFNMPGMNGNEVLKAVKNIRKDIDVIIISGHVDQYNTSSALHKDAKAFFGKPLKIKPFLDTLFFIKESNKN